MLSSDINSDFDFENFLNFVIKKHVGRLIQKPRVFLNKLVAMVTPNILGSQK